MRLDDVLTSCEVGQTTDLLLVACTGNVFQATLRVNAADRSQAFVSVNGLTSDVLVKVRGVNNYYPVSETLDSGTCCQGMQQGVKTRSTAGTLNPISSTQRSICTRRAQHRQLSLPPQGLAQNRAVDGDEVALQILPPAQWRHMRGGVLPTGDLFWGAASDPPLRQLRSSSHSGCVIFSVFDTVYMQRGL